MASDMLTGEGLDLSGVYYPPSKYLKKNKNKIFFGKEVKYPELDPSIRDREDDWLTKQLKEEADAYLRVCDMFGINPHVSDATVLKVEHSLEHYYEKNTQAYR